MFRGQAKMDLIAQKLDLKPGMPLGWQLVFWVGKGEAAKRRSYAKAFAQRDLIQRNLTDGWFFNIFQLITVIN